MRCCVQGCSNDSRYPDDSKQITFHSFPSVEPYRSAWLRALGKTECQLKVKEKICSEHFYSKDLYVKSTGSTKVRTGAVPSCKLDIAPEENSINSQLLKICRLCLKIQVDLYSINKLDDVYLNMTGLSINIDDALPHRVCRICKYRLEKHDAFKKSCLQANNILMEALKNKDTLILETIKSTKLQNDLQITTRIDTYDLILNFVDDKEIEIKNTQVENFNNINESLVLFKDETETVDCEENIPEELQGSVVNDTTDEKDMDIDNLFDTDDSLPLEKIVREKVQRKKKKYTKIKEVVPKIDRRRKPLLNSDLSETLFTIIDLTPEEQIEEIEKRKLTENYKNAVFKCELCFKGFLDRNAYNSHMIRHTDECGEYECNVCKMHFKQTKALRKHITAHHIHKYKCNQCVYVTIHRQSARMHERWHKGTKYSCPHCDEVYEKFTTYMGHLRIKHPSDFVCGLCGYSFVSLKGIDLHQKLKHRGVVSEIPPDGPFCEPCNVRFATNDAYKKHLSISPRHVSKEDKDKNQLMKRRARAIRLRQTTNKDEDIDEGSYINRIKKPEGPLPCEQCGQQLKDSRAYHAHFRRMHPDKNRTNYPAMKTPCMCETCGRIFQSQSLLRDHRWTHTGERPFTCDDCGKTFRMKQRLVTHRRLHAPHKPQYVCNVCGKTFTTQSNKHRHMFIHTGLKPYKCELCGKAFKQPSEKRAHVTYVHLKKPWPKRSKSRRNGQSMSPPSGPTAGPEIPVWQNCEPKLTELNNMIPDKPMYYNNIKI